MVPKMVCNFIHTIFAGGGMGQVLSFEDCGNRFFQNIGNHLQDTI